MFEQDTQYAILPLVPNPKAPYRALGLGSSVLVRSRNTLIGIFVNCFATEISTVGWSQDGTILIAGSSTGEVLAWDFATGETLLANRRGSAYARILGVSLSPGGLYLAAVTEGLIQIWHVATRQCIAVVANHHTTLRWSSFGNALFTDEGNVYWSTMDLA